MVIDDSPSWTEQLGNGLLSLTMDSHRIGARNSPKQAKNEIIQQKFILSACASIYREICLSCRETLRLN